MVNVPISNGPQNVNQAKPAQPAVLASKPSVTALGVAGLVRNVVPSVKNTVSPVQNTVPSIQNTVRPVQNSVPASNVPTVPKQKSDSPWDDDLDVVPAPAKNEPTVVGSLDPEEIPLKVPENVEETVGKKFPAGDFIGAKDGQGASSSTNDSNAQSKGSSGIFGRLFGKKTEQKNSDIPTQPTAAAENAASAKGGAGAPASIENGMRGDNNNSIIKKIFILVPGLVVVFALATLLTEAGLLSIGVEKVYGALGIEQLWGGLSSKTETALGRSALTMQSHPDFKADGKIEITIDRAIKSDIVTPLLTLDTSTGQSLARDESVNYSQKAIKTVADDYYYTTNSNSNSNSSYNSNTSTYSNGNYNSNLSVPPVNANTNLNNNSNYNTEDISVGTKIVQGTFDLKTSSESNEATINLNDETSSIISLVNSNGKLFVKTSGAVSYGSVDSTKWLAFNIDQLKDKSVAKSIFNLSTDSGFSVKGARVGNEKVENTRCYKYRIDSLEIGSSLSEIGITSDMVPTLSGDVWIGIKDKLIHKMSIKITTPVSSAVRMVNVDISFSDYDVKNSITEITSSEQVTGVLGQNLIGDAKRKADAASIIVALRQYKNDNLSYPISPTFLKLNSPDNAILKALVPRYLASLPEDPNSSLGWYYGYKSVDGTKCSINARLEDQSDTSGTLVGNILLYFLDSSD